MYLFFLFFLWFPEVNGVYTIYWYRNNAENVSINGGRESPYLLNIILELVSLGRRVSKMVQFLLWASMSTKMTDQEAPFSPNRLQPLIASSAALASPMELTPEERRAPLRNTERITNSITVVHLWEVPCWYFQIYQPSKSWRLLRTL